MIGPLPYPFGSFCGVVAARVTSPATYCSLSIAICVVDIWPMLLRFSIFVPSTEIRRSRTKVGVHTTPDTPGARLLGQQIRITALLDFHRNRPQTRYRVADPSLQPAE